MTQASMSKSFPTALEQLARCARSNPQHVIFEDSAQKLTFKQIHEAVETLAADLAVAGLKPRQVVAMEGPKAVATFVLLLAVWRAGGVALPIAADLSDGLKERLRARAQITLAIAHPTVKSEMAHIVIDLSRFRPRGVKERPPPLATNVSAMRDEPAYIMTTSGTAGEAKYAIGTLGGLAHFACWQASALEVSEHDRVAQLASLSFDAMLKDVLLALTARATLVIPFDQPLLDPERTLQWIEAASVSVVQTVPSVLKSWLAVKTDVDLGGLKLLCLSGEILQGEDVNRFRRHWPRCSARIWNLYGLTEATILQTGYRVPDISVLPRVPLAVGNSLGDNEVRVINQRGQECAIGQSGEVVIETQYGCQVVEAQGIDSVLKAWTAQPKAARYETGDLARYEETGVIVLEGRRDRVRKIRGTRVDPAQVEFELSRIPDVRHSLALFMEGDDDQLKLYAFVVPENETSFDETKTFDEIKGRLRRQEWPVGVFQIDAIPLTRNGKLDRVCLADVVARNRQAGGDLWAPKDEIEIWLVSLWVELLGHRNFDDRSDFFAAGGHSLTAVQSLARLRTHWSTDVRVRDFFSDPTIRFLAECVRTASQSEDLIDELTPARHSDQRAFPATVGQMGIWLHDRLEAGSNAYLMYGTIPLPKQTSYDRLVRACYALSQRHDSLRTSFHQDADRLSFQIARDLDQIPIERLACSAADWCDLEPTVAARAFAAFNLERAPLWRGYYSGGPTPQLFLIMHHIICDNWSWGVLEAELAALIAEEPISHPPMQFGDYVLWLGSQKELSGQSDRARRWGERFQPEPPLLRLSPNPGADEAAPAPAGLSHRTLDPKLRERVSVAAQRLHATPFMVYFAAFALLLARQTGQNDICIGTDFSGRDRSEFEGTVGFFVQSHAVRLDLDQKQTAGALIAQAKDALLDAQDLGPISFDLFSASSGAKREASQNSLFEIMFRTPGRRGTGVWSHAAEKGLDTSAPVAAKFDMTWTVGFEQGTDHLQIDYRTNRHSAEFIRSLLNRFVEITSWMVAHLETPIAEFGRSAHNSALDRISAPLPSVKTIGALDMLSELVLAQPERTAIELGDETLSYRQLWRRIERVARGLRADHKIAPGCVVAIETVSEFEGVIAFLAVLRAGGVAMFLGSNLPEPQREHMIATAMPAMRIGADFQFDPEPDEDRSINLPNLAALRTSPAYVFFSSGSRNQPKAIEGRHDGVGNFIRWQRDTYGIGPGWRGALTIDFTFDAVLRDMLLPLCSGGTLVLRGDSEKASAKQLLQFLSAKRIDFVHTVPSVLSSALVNEEPPEWWRPALKYIFLSGEPLSRQLMQRIRDWIPKSQTVVENFYGSTECTMIQAAHTARIDDPYDIYPVGVPVDNVEIHVLDPVSGPCTTGELGEITIRSRVACCRYLNATKDLAVRFEQNPYTGDPSDRIYRSGDLGRRLPNGRIEIVGRMDDQAKIRGVAVNTLKVQIALEGLAGVTQACVTDLPSKDGSSELIAFVEPARTGTIPRPTELRDALAATLTSSELPTRWRFIDTLPLLRSGKVDLKRLLQLDAASAEQPQSHGAALEPTNETERVIAEIWANVLDVPSIPHNESFFAIGGHSLLATVAMARINDAFDVQVPLRAIFEHQSVHALAASIASRQAQDQPELTSELFTEFQGSVDKPSLFMVHPIGGTANCYSELAQALVADYATIGISAPALNEAEPIVDDLRSIAFRYVKEITKLYDPDGLAIAGWSFGGLLAYEIARQWLAQGKTIKRLALLDTYAPTGDNYTGFANDVFVNRSLIGDFISISRGENRAELKALLASGEALAGNKLLEALLRKGGLEGILTLDELRHRRALIAAHWAAACRYRFRPLSASVDFRFVYAAAEQRQDLGDQTLGWQGLIKQNIDILSIESTHRGLLDPNYLPELASFLRSDRS